MPNQTTSRIQVVIGSEIIKYRAERAPSGATRNTAGVLKCRCRFGSRTRSTMTPMDTITNASRVPIDTRLAASRTVRMAENTATAIPVMIDVMYGVWYLGWILFTNWGSRPSLDMLQNTRDWPSNMTKITDERPAMAPSLISVDIQPSPARSATTAIGSGTFSSV